MDTWKHWPLCLQIISQTSCLMLPHDSAQPVCLASVNTNSRWPCAASHQETWDVPGLLCSLARVWHSPHSKVTMLPFVLDSQLAGKGFETMQNLSISPHFQPWTLASKCISCLQWLMSPKCWTDSHSTGDENANAPGGATWKVLLFWRDQCGKHDVAAVGLLSSMCKALGSTANNAWTPRVKAGYFRKKLVSVLNCSLTLFYRSC